MKPRESSLLSALRDNEDRWGEIRLTMEELGDITEMSRTTLWRALTSLMDKNLVATTRTKRNLGRLHKNRYKLIKVETSTAGQGNSNIATATKLAIVKNTSYSLGPEGSEGNIMVNKWEEEDDQMSFGLIEDAAPVAKVSKRDPKTRNQRPQAEWTGMDVASEFAVRVYDRIRGIPGIVNTYNLGMALARNRKTAGITAEQELKLMDKFFGDERNLNSIRKFPKGTTGMFLNFITNNITAVSNTVTIEKALAMAEDLEFLIASDGRKFQKSISGRAALDYHEKQLKGL